MLQSDTSPFLESPLSGITSAREREITAGGFLRHASASLDKVFPSGFTRFCESKTPSVYSRLRNPFIAGSMSCEHHQVKPQTFWHAAAFSNSVVAYSEMYASGIHSLDVPTSCAHTARWSLA